MIARLATIVLALTFAGSSCTDTNAPGALQGSYTLVAENGDPVPSDPFAPDGCCVTLSGSISFSGNAYDLAMSYQNKNNGSVFSNTEQGTFVRNGSNLTFTRTGGGGVGFPFLLGPGTVSPDDQTVTLLYGDEGPGSNQIEATFERAP